MRIFLEREPTEFKMLEMSFGERFKYDEEFPGPQANNGGTILTHLPNASSKAIDNGQCITGIATDQRGLTHLAGLACDIGAVERQTWTSLRDCTCRSSCADD